MLTKKAVRRHSFLCKTALRENQDEFKWKEVRNMDQEKFTKKSLEAIENMQKLAYKYQHQELISLHLLYSLLTIDDSLIKELLQKMNVNTSDFITATEIALAGRPKVSGDTEDLHVSQEVSRVLMSAEDQAAKMGDQFISVEHLFLGLLEKSGPECKDLFRKYNINKNDFVKVERSKRQSRPYSAITQRTHMMH